MRLVVGQDEKVAKWAFDAWGGKPFHLELAIGISDDDGNLVGAFAFSGYNGSDAEVHFFGPNRLTRRIVRSIFIVALKHFNLNRLTVRTRKESMARGVQKLGAIYEGTVRRLYGPTDDDRHSGKQFVFLRETIEKLANQGGYVNYVRT